LLKKIHSAADSYLEACRMAKRVWALGAVLVLCVSAQAQPAQEDQSAASKILAVENVWNQAEAKGDIKALSLIFDESLVYVDEDGTLLTKRQFLAGISTAASRPILLVTPTMNVQIYGETAIVTGTYRLAGTERGKPFQRIGRFTDVWVYRNHGWQCVAAQATPIAP
jgi:ketosteroid isomerase-like protein